MRQEPAEERGPLPRPVGQDLRDQAAVVVVEHRQRRPAEEGEGVNVAIDPRLRRRRRIGPDKAGIAVRQVHDEEVRLPLDPADDHDGFAEVGLRMSGRMEVKDLRADTSGMRL